jgi:hypothetical protein
LNNNKTPTIDRRQFKRLAFISNLQLFSGTEFWTSEIIDISLKGVLFTKPENWAGNTKAVYRLFISITNSPGISMNIQIAHIDDTTIGAKWNKIDVGSFSRLKRLLELNTIDRNRINKEISYL